MVDIYGRWIYEPNTPEEKKCDCDRIADWICEKGYTPKTSIEHLVHMIILMFDCCGNYGEYDEESGCKRYVDDSGGFKEFDYEA